MWFQVLCLKLDLELFPLDPGLKSLCFQGIDKFLVATALFLLSGFPWVGMVSRELLGLILCVKKALRRESLRAA